MANIMSLQRPSILELDDSEGLQLILEVRTRRMTPTARSTKSRKKQEASPGGRMKRAFSAMSSEQAQLLLSKIKKG